MPNSRRPWSDWVGFTVYLALAIHLLIVSRSALFLLPTFLHELLIAALFLRRKPARAIATGVSGRCAAYLGSFLLPVTFWLNQHFHWFSAQFHHDRMAATGFVLWSVGVIFGLITLFYLRESFSLEPQARELVMGGPYQLVRHPIYLGYALQYAGMALMGPGVVLVLVVCAWWGLTILRMRFEERILRSTFEEYADYERKVPMILPFTQPSMGQGPRLEAPGAKRWAAQAK